MSFLPLTDLPPPPNGDSHHLLNATNARMSNNIENSNSLILFYIANFVAGISSLIVVSREPIFYFVPRENNILDGDFRKGKDCRFFRQFCCENCSLFHSRTSVNWFSKQREKICEKVLPILLDLLELIIGNFLFTRKNPTVDKGVSQVVKEFILPKCIFMLYTITNYEFWV